MYAPAFGDERIAAIRPDFRGRAVHDFWDSYLKYDCDYAFLGNAFVPALNTS